MKAQTTREGGRPGAVRTLIGSGGLIAPQSAWLHPHCQTERRGRGKNNRNKTKDDKDEKKSKKNTGGSATVSDVSLPRNEPYRITTNVNPSVHNETVFNMNSAVRDQSINCDQ